MKKFKKFIFLALFCALLIPGKAFAFSCKTSQSIGSPDQCFTSVTISSKETTLVSLGTVLVYDVDGSTPAQAGYQVRVSRASADNVITAGIATRRMVTGETGQILVRGVARVLTIGGVATGDQLAVAASGDAATVTSVSPVGASSEPIAVALEASSTNGTTARFAYIRI